MMKKILHGENREGFGRKRMLVGMMRRRKLLYVGVVMALGVVTAVQACDALWGTSVDYSPTPGATISVGVSTPTNVGLSPYYWGPGWYPASGWYPGSGWYPTAGWYPGSVRPGVNGPGWGVPNTPTGNVRPPQRPGVSVSPGGGNQGGLGNTRPGNSVVPPAGTVPDIGASEPGVVMPPSGSGMRPGRH